MSISSALNNAVSGLAVTSRMAEMVSSNTANALTEGYAPRTLSLSSVATGGGVKVNGVTRQINETVLQEKRLADAAAANATVKTAFYSKMETLIGTPGKAGSLETVLSTLETALITASATPENTAPLLAVADAAGAVADKLNALSSGVQAARLEADGAISRQVETLNNALTQVADLNKAITRATAMGGDASALMDQRQVLLDDIAEIVPIRTFDRGVEQIAIYTTGGQALLDGTAAEIGFTPTRQITVDMSLKSDALSGLTINGTTVSTLDGGAMGGGSLSAAFVVRDESAPKMQENLDAFARNLIERFSDPSLDPTLTTGSPGVFTDSGTAFDPMNEIGVAGRIRINNSVDPDFGGEVWRLRDGLGATAASANSDVTLLNALENAMTKSTPALSGSYGNVSQSISALASDLLSLTSTSRQSSEARQSYAVARQETATQQALSQGVDTDREMQILLQVEQSYAANAKVIQAIDEMMQYILEL